jgi:xanthine/uracil permease
LGTPATLAYGENLGIVQLTRVAARAFVIVAAAIFTVLAFIGPFGALMAVMPKEVGRITRYRLDRDRNWRKHL